MKSPNFLFLLLLLICCKGLSAQTHLQIIVSTDKPITKVDVFDLSQQEIFDFDYADTINVSFKKKTADCYNIRFFEKQKQYRQQIWLDTGHIVIHGHLDSNSFIIDTILHAPMYYEAKLFAKKYAEHYSARDSGALNDFLLHEIRKHADNPFYLSPAFSFLSINQNSPLHLAILKSILDSIPEKFDWFILYPTVTDRLNKILSTSVIDLSKYSFTDIRKRNTKIDIRNSQYTILDFWFLSCPPCLKDHIQIKNLYPAFKKMNVEVVSISTDRNHKSWKKYLSKHGYTWPNYLQDANVNITNDLSIAAFPTYIFLDQKGQIIATYNSISQLMKRFSVE